MFGGPVEGLIEDITPTFLTRNTIAKLREADSRASEILLECGEKQPVVRMYLRTYVHR